MEENGNLRRDEFKDFTKAVLHMIYNRSKN